MIKKNLLFYYKLIIIQLQSSVGTPAIVHIRLFECSRYVNSFVFFLKKHIFSICRIIKISQFKKCFYEFLIFVKIKKRTESHNRIILNIEYWRHKWNRKKKKSFDQFLLFMEVWWVSKRQPIHTLVHTHIHTQTCSLYQEKRCHLKCTIKFTIIMQRKIISTLSMQLKILYNVRFA